MRNILAFAATAALFAAPAPAAAQALTSYIGGALDRVEQVWGGRAYNTLHIFDMNNLATGNLRQNSFVAAAPGLVTAIAGCDSDCNRVDLQVVDYQNQPVATALTYDGASMLQFYAQPGQTYWVRAQAADCRTASCWTVTAVVQ